MALNSICFAIGNHIKYLVTVLNSKMGNYLLKDAQKDFCISVQAMKPIRIPIPTKEVDNEFSLCLDKQLNNFSTSREIMINHSVYMLYNLNEEEIEHIERLIK